MMDTPTRILILEDNCTDAEIIQFELEEAGIVTTTKVVTKEEDYIRELQTFAPDVILSDYDLPRYSGASALAEARKRCPDVPFILVTGAVTEDRAIEILTNGAKDFVMKNRLQKRLAQAVRRVMAEAEEHWARKKAEADLRNAYSELEEMVRRRTAALEMEIEERKRTEEALHRSENLRRLAQEITRVGTFEWNIVTGVNTWTPELEALYGLPAGGFAGTQSAWEQLVHPEDREQALATVQKAFETSDTVEDEWRVTWPDGSIHWLTGRYRIIWNDKGEPLTLTGVNIDITERKHAEMALAESEEKFSKLFAKSPVGIALSLEDTGKLVDANQACLNIFKLSAQEALGKDTEELGISQDPKVRARLYAELKQQGSVRNREISTYCARSGEALVLLLDMETLEISGRRCILTTIRDVTERKQALDALRERTERLEAANKELGTFSYPLSALD